jgi:alpha-2-macroglobulin
MRHLIPFFCIIAAHTTAQTPAQLATTSPYSLVFKITNEDAAAIAAQFDKKELHGPLAAVAMTDILVRIADATPIDTIGLEDAPPTNLPVGHYLIVHTEKDNLMAQLWSVNSVFAFNLPSKRGIAFQLLDQKGTPVRDATVYMRGKPLHFNAQKNTYGRAWKHKEGLIEVYRPDGSATFFEAEYNNNKLTFIEKIGDKLHNLRYNGFGFRQMRYRKQDRYRRRHELRGYVVTNQPEYQPGDTVRVKAWVTDSRNRPLDKPLRLELHEQGSRKIPVRDTVKATAPGDYQWQYVLSDSLTLDKAYTVEFIGGKQMHSWRPSLRMDFWYRDYELDVVKFEARTLKDEVATTEKAQISLSATDANRQPVPQASARIVVKATDATRFRAPDVWVPDTLWTHTVELPVKPQTIVALPDSIWPPSDVDATVMVSMRTFSGAVEEFSLPLKYRFAPLRAVILNDTLRVSGPDSAYVTFTLVNEQSPKMQMRLPYETWIGPEVKRITVESKFDNERLYIDNSSVDAVALHLGDTVLMFVQNPNRYQVHYQLWREKNRIESGTFSDSTWRWMTTRQTEHTYRLTLHVMKGEDTDDAQTYTAYYRPKVLNVNILQPEKVVPGEVVDVRIQVTDVDKKPATGVQMAAGAVNQQFKNRTTWSGLRIRQKYKRSPRIYYKYDTPSKPRATVRVSAVPFQNLYKQNRLDAWTKRYALDSSIYYRLLLRSKGSGWTETLPLDSTNRMPEVAPWLVRQGKMEPAFMVYVNHKLAYYHAAEARPFSFQALTGTNSVAIRTLNGYYQIDNIRLKSGQKLELALDLDVLEQHERIKINGLEDSLIVEWAPRPDTLTKSEKSNIAMTMLMLKKPTKASNLYYGQAGDIYHPLRTLYEQMVGPFNPSLPIEVYNSAGLWTKFKFEPGFTYELEPGRERLYEHRMFSRKQRPLSLSKPQGMPGYKGIQLEDFMLKPHERTQYFVQYAQMPADWSGLGTLKLDLALHPDTAVLAVILHPIGLDSKQTYMNTFGPYREYQKITGIRPGQYELVLITMHLSTTTIPVLIRRDSTHYINVKELNWGRDSNSINSINKYLYQIGPDKRLIKRDLSTTTTNTIDSTGNTVLTGIVRDADEGLIGATVKVYMNGTFIRGTITDVEGHYRISIPPGVYQIEVSYTGYVSERSTGIVLLEGQITQIVHELSSSNVLFETEMITCYKIPPSVEGGVLDISRLQTRSVNAIITGRTAETITQDAVIKGSRSDTVDYYVDGVRVTGLLGGYNRPEEYDYEEALESGTNPNLNIRQSFRDYAYWKPTVVTDKRGEAVFRVRYPDNITAWETFAIGMDERGRGGIGTRTVQSWLPVTAELALPRFAIEGDRFEVAGLVNNRTDDSLKIQTRFLLGDRVIKQENRHIGVGFAEYAPVEVPMEADSIHIRYDMQSDRYTDGEKRSIGVLPIGTMETEGEFWYLTNDTAWTWRPLHEHAPVTIHVERDIVGVLVEDIRYLINYTYGCNEQTASRLRALLLADQLQKTAPASMQMRLDSMLGAPKTRQKDLIGCIQRLRKAQNSDGSWGWWPQGQPNGSMTIYVLRALMEAQKAGHHTEAIERGLQWLQVNRSAFTAEDKREAVLFLLEQGINTDATTELADLEKIKKPTISHRLNRLRLLQHTNQSVVRDSLMALMEASRFGGLYCGEDNRNWYNRRAMLTIQAYDLAKTAGWKDVTERIERFWISSRTIQNRNTLETAEILVRLFEAQGQQLAGDRSQIVVNGRDPISTYPTTINIPYGAPVQFQTIGGAGVLYATAYQTWHNKRPEARSAGFTLKSDLRQRQKLVQNNTLVRGEPAEMIVTVNTTERSEYVMIEVPIPAGCSYTDTPNSGNTWGRRSGEVHREYFRDRVAIFCEVMEPGQHEYRIALEPRYTGAYTLNPSRVELMYFPTFYGRNAIGKVGIE